VIVYGSDIAEIAHHERFPAGVNGHRRTDKRHLPGSDIRHRHELLRQRFEEFGAQGVYFFEELVKTRRYGRDEAQRILGLLSTYRREDLRAALERAGRYRAFSLSVVERILAAQAMPRSGLDALQAETRTHLRQIGGEPVPPRPTAEYQKLLDSEETANHGPENDPTESDHPDDAS
jgi:hypothetical protein